MTKKKKPKSVRYPKTLQEWAGSQERHALDPYLEDVIAQNEQGVNAAGDRSVRAVPLPPNESSGGKPRLVIIGSRDEAVAGMLSTLQSGFVLETVKVTRPSKELLANVVQRMGLPGIAAPALPPAKASAVDVRGNFTDYADENVTTCDDCGATIVEGRHATDVECNAHVCRQAKKRRTR